MMPSRRLDALTSLRFIAAAMILLHHIKGNMGVPQSFPLNLDYGLGFGVSFFFVLSGFILTYNYPALLDGNAVRRFLVSRFARLWPAHMAALALTFLIAPGYVASLVPWTTPIDMAAHLALTVAMVHTWVPVQWMLIGFNSPNWSISTEFAFYLLFPLLIVRFARTWWWKLLLVAAFTFAVIYLAHVFQVPAPKSAYDGITTDSLLYTWPGVRLLEFVGGMCAACAWWFFSARIDVGRTLGTVIEIAALALFVTQIQSGAALTGLFPKALITDEFWRWYISAGITIWPSCLLIFVMALQMGWISRALSAAPLVFLGEISYSLYLVHFPVLRSDINNLPFVLGLPNPVRLIASLAIIFALSCLIWRFIEVPGKKYIVARLSNRPRRDHVHA